LHDLALRPNDSPEDNDVPDFRHSASFSGHGFPSLASTLNLNSVLGLTASLPSYSNLINGLTVGNTQSHNNPEMDSFIYIETLLESLAVLGKLGSTLDIVAQRLSGGIFSLVETTIDEVGERAEYGRRTSLLTAHTANPTSNTQIYTSVNSGPAGTSVGGIFSRGAGPTLDTSKLRLTALESSTKHADHEILRDLFWTLYSKLDAVMQGLKVVYEVANLSNRAGLHDSMDFRHRKTQGFVFHTLGAATSSAGLKINDDKCGPMVPIEARRMAPTANTRGQRQSQI